MLQLLHKISHLYADALYPASNRIPPLKNKIFIVDFPPLPKDEEREYEINRLRNNSDQNLTDKELGLLLAIEKCRGW